jgi:predicted transcriptional regulator
MFKCKGESRMEQKEQYTFEELCNNLEISMSAFSKASNVDEGTIARIRKGFPARRSTVNKLLRAFSEIYGIKLSTENVTGIALQGAEKALSATHEQAPRQSILTMPINDSTQIEQPLNCIVESRRAYTRKKDTGLPDGCMPATEFAAMHGIKRETFRDHMLIGLGTDKDRVDYSEREKPNRPKEKERYLTPSQQSAALDFWKRHKVQCGQCDQPGCPCHEKIQTGQACPVCVCGQCDQPGCPCHS